MLEAQSTGGAGIFDFGQETIDHVSVQNLSPALPVKDADTPLWQALALPHAEDAVMIGHGWSIGRGKVHVAQSASCRAMLRAEELMPRRVIRVRAPDHEVSDVVHTHWTFLSLGATSKPNNKHHGDANSCPRHRHLP